MRESRLITSTAISRNLTPILSPKPKNLQHFAKFRTFPGDATTRDPPRRNDLSSLSVASSGSASRNPTTLFSATIR